MCLEVTGRASGFPFTASLLTVTENAVILVN